MCKQMAILSAVLCIKHLWLSSAQYFEKAPISLSWIALPLQKNQGYPLYKSLQNTFSSKHSFIYLIAQKAIT